MSIQFKPFQYTLGLALLTTGLLATGGNKPEAAIANPSAPISQISQTPTMTPDTMTPGTMTPSPMPAMSPTDSTPGTLPPTNTVPGTGKPTKPRTKPATLSPDAQSLGVKPENPTTCPSTALVKGKVSKRGKIYHLPKTTGYDQVKPTICFADAPAAEKAGFRAPKNQSTTDK